jgi:DNA gyrase subunit B
MNGKKYYQRYQIGAADDPVKEVPADFGAKSIFSRTTGTTIRWSADPSIFQETTTYNFEILATRLRELAFLNKGISIVFRDERLTTPKEVTYKFEGGIGQFVSYLNENRQCVPSAPLFIGGEKDDIIVELAMQYNDGYAENVLSFVNDIKTKEGGTHLDGLKMALTRVMNEFLKNYPKVQKKLEKDEKLIGEDVRAGLTSVLSIKVPEPQFEGQTKTKLGNSEVRGIVDSLVNEQLTLFFEQNPKLIEGILEKCVGEASARVAARKAKEATRRKSGLDTFGLPGKLADCSAKDPSRCEVYIVEGDSAGGSAKKGRDSKTQAILPLWGKMLNVERARIDKVINNDKLQPLIATLGTSIGTEFDISKIRYHKIIIMADADVDGSHIRTLLLTFFFRYMPALIEQGFIYLAMPPLFKISAGKKEWYVYDDNELDKLMTEIGRNSTKISVQRYKGLGEMDGNQLWDTTMDPSKRKMKRVILPDAIEADRIFSTLMGEEVEPRRKFIEENAVYANLDV